MAGAWIVIIIAMCTQRACMPHQACTTVRVSIRVHIRDLSVTWIVVLVEALHRLMTIEY